MINNNLLEELFQWATQDLAEWHDVMQACAEHERKTPACTLLRLFANRARLQAARAEIAAIEVPEMATEAQRFQRVHDKAVTAFDRLLTREQDFLAELMETGEGLMERLETVETALRRLRHLVQDGILADNAEWLRDEYDQAVLEFLIGFDDFAFFFQGVPAELRGLAGFGRLQGRFTLVETLLRQWHGILHGAGETLAWQLRRSFGAPFWWLTETPPTFFESEQVEELEKLLPAFGDLLRRTKGTVAACPDEALLDDFALGRDLSDGTTIAAHVEQCRDCRDYVAARRESEAIRTGQKEPDAKLLALIRAAGRARPTLNYADLAELERDLSRMPAEVSASGGRRSAKVLPFASRRDARTASREDATTARLLRLQPDPSALPLAADSGNGGRFLAKRIEVAGGKLVSTCFFPACLQGKAVEGDCLLVGGVLEPGEIPTAGQWSCAWENPDGELVFPDNYKIQDVYFRAAFPYPQAQPEGRLLLLLLGSS